MKLPACLTVCWVLCVGMASGAVPLPPRPVPVARVSVAGLQQTQSLLTDLGLATSMPNVKNIVASMFAFLGPDGLLMDRPLGIILVGSDFLPPRQGIITAVPLNPKINTAALAQLGQNVPGHPDIITLGGTTHLRRLNNYLMMYGGDADILAGIPGDAFTRDYLRPGRLVSATLDLVSVRKAMPDRYHAFLTSLAKPDPKATPAQTVKAQADHAAVEAFINKLERVSLALGHDPQNLHLELALQPVNLKSPRRFPQPAFPPTVVAQMHLVYPDIETANWLSRIIENLPADYFNPPSGTLTGEQYRQIQSLLVNATVLLGAADAQSLALELREGMPILYAVNQYAVPVDITREVQDLVAAINAWGKDVGQGELLNVTTYSTAAGQTITRVALRQGGTRQANLDLIQNGRRVTMALAPDDGQYVAALAALPPKGEMFALCAGTIDLAAGLKANAASRLPPEQLAQLRTACHGKFITWTAHEANRELLVDIGIPLALAQQAGKLLASLRNPLSAGKDAGAPAPAAAPRQ